MLDGDKLYNLLVCLQVLRTSTSPPRPTFAIDLPIRRAELAQVLLIAQRFVISGARTGATKE